MVYKVAFETFGCRLNQAETASLYRGFLDKGYDIVTDPLTADLCVINTCALTSQAAAKCRRKVRSILKKNPHACVAAVGCYAQTDVEVLRSIEGIDYIVGTADKLNLPDIVPSPRKQPQAVIRNTRITDDGFLVPGAGHYPFHTRANLKIQEGCDFVCSYCIVPRSRGPARSRAFEDILREARELAALGHREIVLTGVNIGTYRDNGRGLVDIIDGLTGVPGLERIRLSSIEPTTIEPAVIDRMAEGGRLCPYLHLPAQSGDDAILAAMRRKYCAGEFTSFVHSLVQRIPGIGLGTDIMVGFPGESGEAFRRSYDLVRSLPFTHIHVFSFSARKRTGACSLPGKIPANVIAERSAQMHELGESKKEEYYRSHVGRRLHVLFEEREADGYFTGFSDNYVKVAARTDLDLSNRFAAVKIVDTMRAGEKAPLTAVGDIVEVEAEHPRGFGE
jgi:threonylcarbamoyladenosine tRNA methylthiotransferase MtaB